MAGFLLPCPEVSALLSGMHCFELRAINGTAKSAWQEAVTTWQRCGTLQQPPQFSTPQARRARLRIFFASGQGSSRSEDGCGIEQCVGPLLWGHAQRSMAVSARMAIGFVKAFQFQAEEMYEVSRGMAHGTDWSNFLRCGQALVLCKGKGRRTSTGFVQENESK